MAFLQIKLKKKALNSGRFKTLFNMHRIERTGKMSTRMDRFDKKIHEKKEKIERKFRYR